MCAESNDTTKILMGLSGVIRSTRMTLVLGAPGSGKSTFLRVLAGKLDPSLKFEGKVTYKVEAKSSAPEHLSAYVSQHDLHHAEMTVRETINFSSNMLGTSNEFEMLREVVRQQMGTDEATAELFSKATVLGEGSNLKTNYIIQILGLSTCADTIIGDELQRGVSGGQKKRTTIGRQTSYVFTIH
uniref:ABC transporter domain-containing protein n=1 Tax=Zea mays TaxID=4577 RepID=A0A804QA10_MAIZE